jgi:transcriptional regulator with XRE-family HTH domain
MFETWAEDVVDRREKLAALLHEERKARKIRQQELARKLDRPQSRISLIENGECHIDVAEFLALADAIGFDPGMALKKIRGRRISKPKPAKRNNRAGPTFIAEFSDGVQTRMTVYTPLDELDWDRGVRLAQAAYQSRTRKPPPAIIAARFERDGQVLAQRNGGGDR